MAAQLYPVRATVKGSVEGFPLLWLTHNTVPCSLRVFLSNLVKCRSPPDGRYNWCLLLSNHMRSFQGWCRGGDIEIILVGI